MSQHECPRVLLLSNNALRAGGSNGRVLQELFAGWDPDCLAQFYIYDETPDDAVCHRYYRVTDRQALTAFIKGEKGGGPITPAADTTPAAAPAAATGGIGRNPLTCLVRDLVWDSRRWQSEELWQWIEDYSPQLVLLQVGDSAFMPRLAMQIAKRFSVPLAFYCTENYYFKKHNYFKGAGGTGWDWVYPLFRHRLTRAFRRLMQVSDCEIYNSAPLEALHRAAFGKQGYVLYQPTSLRGTPKAAPDDPLRFCYAGNLGLGRHHSLIEIAAVLQGLDPRYVLDVYGQADPAVAAALDEAAGIRYHGRVDYTTVCQAMEESDFLFHAESFDPAIVQDLVTAFSTKIADSLASGRCFVLYAHESLACTRYLSEQGGACVITDPAELAPRLRALIRDEVAQRALITRAAELVADNHNADQNSRRFQAILSDTIKEYEVKQNG